MDRLAGAVERLLARHEGVLRLRPTYARRLYPDGGRLRGHRPGATFSRHDRMWKPERWIASTTEACNPNPIVGEGLSRVFGAGLTLRDAIRAAPEFLLGPRRYAAHGAEFRVLIKLLDGQTPIPLHFHASDAAVTGHPRHFRGHRFGKEEAYYFLDGPKGGCPYTHVGLRPTTSPAELLRAIAQGGETALELSPCFLQRHGEGFLIPAGVVHRPGTALTLEIQQPSDVSIKLDDRIACLKLAPEQMHPGFRTLRQAIRFIDFETSTLEDVLDRFRLLPKPIPAERSRHVIEEWIFPPQMCRKFSGKRLRAHSRITSIESDCYAVLVWKGEGKLGPHQVRKGDEFFVSWTAARKGVKILRQGTDTLELFKFFAAPVP